MSRFAGPAGITPTAAARWAQARPVMTMIVTAMAATPAHAAALYPPLAGKAWPCGVYADRMRTG